jgi:serine phosphatase RsbU (regulator of sigma subunit)
LTSTFTTEFGHEYEKERGRWLRRRFLWYAAVSISLNILGLLISTAVILGILIVGPAFAANFESTPSGNDDRPPAIHLSDPEAAAQGEADDAIATEFDGSAADAPAGGSVPADEGQVDGLGVTAIATLTQQFSSIPALLFAIVLYFDAFRRVRRTEMSREALLSLVSRLIIFAGAAGTVCLIIGFESIQWISPPDYRLLEDIGFAPQVVRMSLIGVMLSHFLASLFLPWTPRESLRPIIPLALLNFGVALFYSWSEPGAVGVAVLFSLIIAVPGLAVCWLRNSRFRSKFHFKMVTRRYGEMKNELDAARQIHDAMFPAAIEDGPVRMRYAYEPMRQIGGDYLFTHRVDTEAGEGRGLLIVLLDVTGHGITAALTVNRLQGEIERQVSMNRAVTPGTVLSGLNDYLHHTLARHSVYATALVVRVDPDAGTAVWASAGHPPGFLCTVDGAIHHLESTTIVLGATRGEHFESVEEQLPFGRGDTLLAYTDGVIEAKNDHGRMLRIEGVEKFLAGHCRTGGQDEDVARLLLEYVNGFRAGPAQDDSLIVEVRRPFS